MVYYIILFLDNFMDYKDFIQLQNQQNLHFWYKARKNLIFNLLNFEFKNCEQNKLILNIGCGTGTELEILKKFGQVIGLDNNLDAIKLIQKQNYKIITADIEKYNLQNNYYDAICCFDVLEHLRNDQTTLKNIFKSLKKDGFFFFTIPAYQCLFGPHDIYMSHYRRYSKKNILQKLEKAGFQIIKLNYWNSILFPIIFIIRIIKKYIKKETESETKILNKNLNELLFRILNFENKFIYWNVPILFGLTVYGIAKK